MTETSSRPKLINGTPQLVLKVTITLSLTVNSCLKLKQVLPMKELLTRLETNLPTPALILVTPTTLDGKYLTKLCTTEMLHVLSKLLAVL